MIDGCSRVICPEAINAVHESFKQGSNEQWSNDYWFSVLVFLCSREQGAMTLTFQWSEL